MYIDMTDEELQAWLLGESVGADAILGTDDEWQAAQTFREHMRDRVSASQFRREPFDPDELLDDLA